MGLGQFGDVRHHQHLAHLEHIDAKQLVFAVVTGLAQTEQQEFEHAAAGRGTAFFLFGCER